MSLDFYQSVSSVRLIMKIILVCVIIGIAFAEKPAPYPARGWKPQGQRLELPSREYGAPIDPNNVEFTTVSNEYGPPPATPRATTDDFLQVVPAANSFSQFRQQQNQQAGKSVINGRQFLLSPSFAPQFRAQQERLREQNFQNPKNDAQRFNVNFNGKSKKIKNYFRYIIIIFFFSSTATSTKRIWCTIYHHRIPRNSNCIPSKFSSSTNSQHEQ